MVSFVLSIVYVLGNYMKIISVVFELKVIRNIKDIIVIVWLFFIWFNCIVKCEKLSVLIVLYNMLIFNKSNYEFKIFRIIYIIVVCNCLIDCFNVISINEVRSIILNIMYRLNKLEVKNELIIFIVNKRINVGRWNWLICFFFLLKLYVIISVIIKDDIDIISRFSELFRNWMLKGVFYFLKLSVIGLWLMI